MLWVYTCVYFSQCDPLWFQSGSGGETIPGVVTTLDVEMRGEGVVGEKEARREAEEKGERGRRTHAHPDDLATSIRPYHGSKMM